MTLMTTTNPTRRGLLALAAAGAAVALLPRPALALTDAEAKSLIDTALGEVYRVINSGKPEAQMFKDFEAIFTKYADVNTIARSALGPAARAASPQDLADYTLAFRGYIGRKYGRRFRDFIGSKIEVVSARPVKTFWEVKSMARLKGRAPFEALWHVSDRSGKNLFFNIIIEGVNMLAAERSEVGAMLDANRGDMRGLIATLQKSG
ncbi:phospholipid-binding protein MlaC [Paracoccus sp. p4-l81]|uniref:MlaC/ttg2D family ABC transporter substrate-binding protein n=1 Tax=unclassified Paracoccus (in: a-proteobacteria) TaxID=2688777 RepID=UPI0035BB3322